MSPRVPGNKPAEVTEESASAAILEAVEANARAAGAAASARSREGQNGPAAAAFASAARDLAEALRLIESPPPPSPQTDAQPEGTAGTRQRVPLSQRARAYAERALES
jgi:hypothetical protein